MIMYAVFREGCYRHECGGIFSSLVKAEDAARKLIEWEKDSYHTYEVVPFEIDIVTDHDDDELHEPDKLAAFTKNDDVEYEHSD